MAEAKADDCTGSGVNLSEETTNVMLTDTKSATKLLTGIVHAATSSRNVSELPGDDLQQIRDAVENLDLTVSDKMFCSYCNSSFTDREEQMSHYKTDWHRFNLKQKLRNARNVSVEEFEDMTGDISSISGSESENSDNEEAISKKIDSDYEDESSGHIEGIGKRHPRVFFRNSDDQLLSIFRCVIHGKKNQPETLDELVSLAKDLPDQMTWAFLMTAGGHFAGAVFKRGEMVVHKTFHRYVVRAKRGTAQSARDAQGNAPKSAGANLRRYNEAALTQEIQDLLVSWSDHLKDCDRIFIRVPSYNKTLYHSGKGSPIKKDDTRLRMIPFSTRRPTLKEVRRVHDLLATTECYGSEADLKDHIQKSPHKQFQRPIKPPVQQAPTRKKKKARQAEVPEVSSSEEEETDTIMSFQQEIVDTGESLKPFYATKKPRKKKGNVGEVTVEDKIDKELKELRNSLFTACKTGDFKRLSDIIYKLECPVDTKEESPCNETSTCDNKPTVNLDSAPERISTAKHKYGMSTSDILNKSFGTDERTLLHVATAQSHKKVIYKLLEAGADPAIKDMFGEVPYNCASTKDVKNEFRTFMRSYPEKYNYVTAQVPPPMSLEQEAEKKAKEAEKKKAQKKVRKEKQKVQREIENKKQEEEKERQRYLALSDREKRALAAEKRLAGQITASGGESPVLSRCFQCAADMTGKVPFEYYDFKFCSTKCLKEHKAKSSNGPKKS